MKLRRQWETIILGLDQENMEIQDVDMEERVEWKTTEDITKNIDNAGTSTVENTSHGGN